MQTGYITLTSGTIPVLQATPHSESWRTARTLRVARGAEPTLGADCTVDWHA